MTFKDGDIVSLIVGGPLMVVEMTRDDGIIPAVWFNNSNELQRDCFHPDMLRKRDSAEFQNQLQQFQRAANSAISGWNKL